MNLLANVRDLAHAAAGEIVVHLFPGAAAVTVDNDRLCVVGGRRPHTATDGRLCRDHFEELGRWLHDIETEARRLTAAPSMSTSWDAGGGSLASLQSPARLDAIVYHDYRTSLHGSRHTGPVCRQCPTLAGRRCTCPQVGRAWRQTHWATCPRVGAHPSCLEILADRDEQVDRGAMPGHEKAGDPQTDPSLSVLAALHTWADRVREGRLIGIPTRRLVDKIPGVPVCDDLDCPRCKPLHWYRDVPAYTIRSERNVLSRQLEWIATQPWVTEMRRELGDVRRQLMRATHNEPDEPLPGSCPWMVDGQECGGHLWPEKAPAYATGYDTDRDEPPPPRAVVCELNPKHRWEGRTDLARLTLIVEQQRREDNAS